jgi:hypothetical protein
MVSKGCPVGVQLGTRSRELVTRMRPRQVPAQAAAREAYPLGLGQASYVLSLDCDYDREHCYLSLR